jgi:prevent-host-death family protein
MYILVMSKRYSIAEARAKLPTIVDEAEAGNEVELTRRGKPVAVVVSCQMYRQLRSETPNFDEAYHKFLESFPLEEIGLEGDFFGSVRASSQGREVRL